MGTLLEETTLLSFCLNGGQELKHFLPLTLKAPIMTAADNIHKYFFSEKTRLDVSSESSARQRIHMKESSLFSSKDKSKKLKMSSAAIFV